MPNKWWHVLATFSFDSRTARIAKGRVVNPSYTYEARLLSAGYLDRSISVPSGLYQGSDAVIEIAESDLEFRAFLSVETPLRRLFTLKLMPNAASEAAYNAFGVFEILDAEFEAGKCIISGRDITWAWIDKQIPGLGNRTNFPYLMDGVDEFFFPILQGICEPLSDVSPPNPQGLVKLPRMTLKRWALCQTPIVTATFVKKEVADEEFTPVSVSDYTIVEEEQTINGITYDLVFLDFDVDQPEGMDVRVLEYEGIYFRGDFGSMPAVITSPISALRNPIDFLINMMYALLANETRILSYNVTSFSDTRTLLETANTSTSPPSPYYCDGAITEPMTAREFLGRFLTSFELDLFVNRYGQITVGITLESDPARPVFSDGPIFGEDTDNSLIKVNSVRQRLANPHVNRLHYSFAHNYATGEWGLKDVYNNEDDQLLLGGTQSPAIPEIVPDRLDLWFVRDPDVAIDVVRRRMEFLALGSYRIEFHAPLPEVYDLIELAKLMGVTHYGGLAPGGFQNTEFKTTGLTYDLNTLDCTLRGILRVPQELLIGGPLTPEIYPGFWAVSQSLVGADQTFERSAFYYNTDDYDEVVAHLFGGVASSNDPVDSHNCFIVDENDTVRGTIAIPPNVEALEQQLLTPVEWNPLSGGHVYRCRMGDFDSDGDAGPEITPARWAPLIITHQRRGWTKTRPDTHTLASNPEYLESGSTNPTGTANGGDGEDGTNYDHRCFDQSESTFVVPDGIQEQYDRYTTWYRQDSRWGGRVSNIRFEGVLGWGGLGLGLEVSQSFMTLTDPENEYDTILRSAKGNVAEDPLNHFINHHIEEELPNLKSYYLALSHRFGNNLIVAKGYKSQVHVCVRNVSGQKVRFSYEISRSWTPTPNVDTVMTARRQVLDLEGATEVFLEAEGSGSGSALGYGFHLYNFGNSNSGTSGTVVPDSELYFGISGIRYDRTGNLLAHLGHQDRVGLYYDTNGTAQGKIHGAARVIIVRGSISASDAPTIHDGYNYRRTITIDQTKVPSDQTDFTVLVDFTDASLLPVSSGGKIQNVDSSWPSGSVPADLGFFSDSSLATPLSFEIEEWNGGTGYIRAWVKISALSGSVDTRFYMAYGDAAITSSPQDPPNAWNSGYKAVYHNPADGIDSTVNNNDGTPTNGPLTVAGKIGDGGDFEQSSSQYLDVPNNFNFGDLTYSAWVKAESFPNAYNGIVIRSNGTTFSQLLVKSTGKLACYASAPPSTLFYDGTGVHTLSTGTFYYLAMTVKNSDHPTPINGYVNGVADGDDIDLNDIDTASVETTVGGNAGAYWDGVLDEVRISNVARSSDWVLTEYNSMVAGFLSVGSEVTI